MSLYAGRHRAATSPQPRARIARPQVIVPSALAAGLALTATGAVLTQAPAHGSQVDSRLLATSLASTPPPAAAATSAEALDQAREFAAAQQDRQRQTVAGTLAASAEQGREQILARAQRDTNRIAINTRIAKQKAIAKAKTNAAHRWVFPLKKPVMTSPFGHRWGKLHAGLDFGTPVGTALHAMSTGRVTEAGWAGGYGMRVEITYWDGTQSWFAHMSKISVKKGDKVNPGTLVGASGNTGHSTGPHLHLEIHPHAGDPVDPKPWLIKHGLKAAVAKRG